MTPQRWIAAAQQKDWHGMQDLLDAGCAMPLGDIVLDDWPAQTVLHAACDPEPCSRYDEPDPDAYHDRRIRAVQLVLAQPGVTPSFVNRRDAAWRTALHLAATSSTIDLDPVERSDPRVVRALLAAGADVNALDNHRRSAIHNACDAGCDLETVHTLIDAGARLDVAVRGMWTPLRTAEASLDEVESCRLVADEGTAAMLDEKARLLREVIDTLRSAGA